MAERAGARGGAESAARAVTLGVAALVGALTCLVVAFAAAPVASALGGFASVVALAAGTAAVLAGRRATRARAHAEKLSAELDLLSQRLLHLENRPASPPALAAALAPALAPPPASAGDAFTRQAATELTAEIGILGGIVRDLAVAVAGQDEAITALHEAARAPAIERPAPPVPPAPRADPAPRTAPTMRTEPVVRTEPAMRTEPPRLAPPVVPAPATRAPRPDREAARRESAILAAFSEDALELHLQPVVTLPQRRVAFYEALPCLRLGEERLGPSGFVPVLERAGQAADLDRRMLARAVTVARHLAERGSGARIAYALTPAATAEPGFLRALTRLLDAHPEAHGRLLLALPQRTWRGLGAEAAGALAALGGRVGFMLDRVQDLRLDALALAERGIGHVKVPVALLAAAFDAGGRSPDIAVGDLAAVLARAGVRLVAEGVEREADVPDLLDLDIPLAQGTALAPPRVVRAEVLAPPAAAPAAPAPAPEVPPEPVPVTLEPAPEAPTPVRMPFRAFLRRAS